MNIKTLLDEAKTIPGIAKLGPMDGRVFYGGTWRKAAGGVQVDVHDPATGDVVARITQLDHDEVDACIGQAVDAFARWRRVPAIARGDALWRWYDVMRAHRDVLARLMTIEEGKPLAESYGEVDYAISYLRWYADAGRRLTGDTIPTNSPDLVAGTTLEPIGVVAILSTWNFPMALIIRKAVAALAAGCTVIVKPADETPYCALALAGLAEAAGLTDGQFSVVTADGKCFSEWVGADPRVQGVSYTGSTHIGREVLKHSAATVKRTSMELGGNAPFVICEDANFDVALKDAFAAKFQTSGQDCIAANRIFVHRRHHDAFVEAFARRMLALRVGNGLHEGVDIGPLINTKAVAHARALIEDARSHGATVTTHGDVPDTGYFLPPTLITGVTPGMRVFHEEVFAPIATVCVFDDDDEAIASANQAEVGLAGYVHTTSIARANRYMRELNVGLVGVNAMNITGAHVPFGGVRQSGHGREGALAGILEFVHAKYYCINTSVA